MLKKTRRSLILEVRRRTDISIGSKRYMNMRGDSYSIPDSNKQERRIRFSYAAALSFHQNKQKRRESKWVQN